MLLLTFYLALSIGTASFDQQLPGTSHQLSATFLTFAPVEISLVTKPKFREGYYVDKEPGPPPHGGGVRDRRRETWLEFEHEGRTYSTLWSAKGWRNQVTPAPINLDKNTTYKFLIRLDDPETNSRCTVLKIWQAERLLWSRR